MHTRRRHVARRWRRLGLTICSVLLAGCGSESAGLDPDDGDGDPTAAACPALSLGASSAQPLTRISLGDVPFTLDGLLPGELLQFTAEVSGLENPNVRWDASLGDIDDDGLYTPPPNVQPLTQVTITATSVVDATIADMVTITVGCACTFEVTVGGTSYTATGGDVARFRTGEFDPYNGNIVMIDLFRTGDLEWPQYENWTGLLIAPDKAGLPAPIDVGAGGDFGLLGDETHFVSHPGSLPGDPPIAPALVTLTSLEWTENLMRGAASGDVYATSIQNGMIALRRAAYDLSFNVTLPDGCMPTEVGSVNEYMCTVPGGAGGGSN